MLSARRILLIDDGAGFGIRVLRQSVGGKRGDVEFFFNQSPEMTNLVPLRAAVGYDAYIFASDRTLPSEERL